MSGERTIKIAVAQAMSGKTAVCGPDDFAGADYSTPMDAALCWLIEAGEIPAERYWITVELPAPALREIDLDADLSLIPSPRSSDATPAETERVTGEG